MYWYRFFGGCILASSALNLIVPTAVSVGLALTCVMRLLQGLCEVSMECHKSQMLFDLDLAAYTVLGYRTN